MHLGGFDGLKLSFMDPIGSELVLSDLFGWFRVLVLVVLVIFFAGWVLIAGAAPRLELASDGRSGRHCMVGWLSLSRSCRREQLLRGSLLVDLAGSYL